MSDQTATTVTSSEYLRNVRLEKGLSVSDVAKGADVSETTVRRAERDGVAHMGVVTIVKLLRGYGLKSSNELFDSADIVAREAEIREEGAARRARISQR